jgi:hypothetical protein
MTLELLSVVVIPSLLLHLAIASSNGTGGNASCAPARCGELSITYPFSLGGVQPLDCGYPGFDLTCDAAGRAYLSRTFRERLYHVKEIFYDNNSLVVAVETTFTGDETCRIPDFNISSGLTLFPLNISSTNKNVTFVYNCEVPPRVKLPRTCANHSIGAYFSDDSEAWTIPKNCIFVSVPVRGFQMTTVLARDYGQLISDGFLLEWPAMEDCDACIRLGGVCRFVQLSTQCFCGEGRPCHTSSRGKQHVMPLPDVTFETQILSQYAMIFIYL